MIAGSQVSMNRTARLAGALYLSLMPFAFFSFLYVPSVLLVRGDAAATSRNIMASQRLFRSGTVSHLVSQVIVVFLALTMYRLLKRVSRDRAVLMVVLALLGIPMAFLNEAHNLAVLKVLSLDDGVFTSAQIQSQVMLFLDTGRNGVLVAQIFWGLWLLPLGSLVFRSGFLPRMLAVPVVVAGGGYLFDSFTQLLSPGLATVSQFTFIAELLLPLWLLIKGVSVERWQGASVA